MLVITEACAHVLQQRHWSKQFPMCLHNQY